jgi:DMSO/TMAO reductase YedYZ molybdopterin-dependent catalytic subunit
MSRLRVISRRVAIAGGLAGAGGLIYGTNTLTTSPAMERVFGAVEDWTLISQRALLAGGALAREFRPKDISPVFRANGTLNPNDSVYDAHVAAGFATWQLRLDGLVKMPMSLSLAQLTRLPARTQITKHDCVEGWSAIGMWRGVQLGLLLKAVGLLPDAKYVVFHCADNLTGEPAKGGEQSPGQYYESIDLTDAFHPQTILAYALNGRPLDVAHGAPLRLRVERQLGYKQAKYVQRIEAVRSFARLAGGKGGYWEDRGYEWYAGI